MSEMIKIPNVAGAFYPGEQNELMKVVDDYLSNAKNYGKRPRALIAPHAGYIYSGGVAASAYNSLKQYKDTFKRVLLMSPTHYFTLQAVAIHNARAFRTPLGDVNVDRESVEKLVDKKLVVEAPMAFEREHALEVHLPFLQRTLGEFQLIPLIVGQVDPDTVKKVIETFDDGDTLVVISSDLSHFHNYETCQNIDNTTKDLLEKLNYNDLDGKMACGYYPLRGLLKWAQERNLSLNTIDIANSGDTAGDRERVVGYGSFLIA